MLDYEWKRGYGEIMNERDKETIKLVATMLANMAAIAVGVALFEGKPGAMLVGSFFALAAFFSIRGLR